jgi:hypothetical protein
MTWWQILMIGSGVFIVPLTNKYLDWIDNKNKIIWLKCCKQRVDRTKYDEENINDSSR